MSKPWWKPILQFALHTITGSAIFVVIAMPAVCLSVLNHYLESKGVPRLTLNILTVLEHAILIVDSILFLVYLGLTAMHSIKEMYHSERTSESAKDQGVSKAETGLGDAYNAQVDRPITK